MNQGNSQHINLELFSELQDCFQSFHLLIDLLCMVALSTSPLFTNKYICAPFVCVYVCAMPEEARRRHLIPWNRSYYWLCATM